jgi:Ecdysteroid kinase-like family
MAVEVTEQDLEKILQKFPKNRGNFQNFEIRRMSDEILGFWADHYILRIITSTGFFDFFFKVYPRNIQKRIEYLTQFNAFNKELKFYDHFLPKLKDKTGISWNAECYLTKESHFIVLEHLEDFKVKCIGHLLGRTIQYFLC